jgi:3'-phosphoadenosine 5'-phosphosulfate sulfotransferase (PAPS reductase)/FAD synthetase
MIAGRWFITPHAVRQYIARARPGLLYEEARDELIAASERAHFVRHERDECDLYRLGKPLRLRLIVSRRGTGLPQLVTVLSECDILSTGGTSWRNAKDRVAERAEAERRAAAVAVVMTEVGGRRAALRDEDFVNAQLSGFRRRVDHALELIEQVSREHGPIGVSFSGGKDSTVTLDLVRRVVPDAPCALFDSGTELPETLEMARAVGAELVQPRMSMLDMARYAGWWGCSDAVDPGCAFDAKAVLIDEPSEAFVVRRRLRTIAHGVRAEESNARARHATRGEYYQGADRTWYLMPVLRWSLSDIWAYLASRGLHYHPAYDAMSTACIPREHQRVASALGERGSGWGRHVLLRRYAPDVWATLAREFPGLARNV